MRISDASADQLHQLENELSTQYNQLVAEGLNLDLTRGKPATQQLNLANKLDGILDGNYIASDGTDTRNYGGLRGISNARQLGAELMSVPADNVIAGGNASLTLMYLVLLNQYQYGISGEASAWKNLKQPKIICPVPGYDRHFTLCENLNIEMINVPMLADGPDMDAVEALIKSDSDIVGMWCVPKYSNPTGNTYSDATVQRIAQLGDIASTNFRVLWDNAYAVHDFTDQPDQLASIWAACEAAGNTDLVWQFASTSKITFAGGGVAFVASSENNLKSLEKLLSVILIGFDKVNQLRHCKLLPNVKALQQLMAEHAQILAPKFTAVLDALNENLSDEYGSWTDPVGGYFISFDTLPNLASDVIEMSAKAGVKLTPAGATFPYGKDPDNKNIRLAPSLPPVDELNKAMQVFITCVKLATVRHAIAQQ